MSRENPDYLENDYYDCLGVQSDASLVEIKKAYRELALQFHPDKNPASEAKARFQAISEAYTVLSDSDKKADYDVQSPFGYKVSSVPSVSTPAPKPASPAARSQSTNRMPAASEHSWAGFWQPMIQLVSIAASLTFLVVSVASVVATQKVSSRNASFSLIGLLVLWQNRDGLEDLMRFDSDFSSASPAA